MKLNLHILNIINEGLTHSLLLDDNEGNIIKKSSDDISKNALASSLLKFIEKDHTFLDGDKQTLSMIGYLPLYKYTNDSIIVYYTRENKDYNVFEVKVNMNKTINIIVYDGHHTSTFISFNGILDGIKSYLESFKNSIFFRLGYSINSFILYYTQDDNNAYIKNLQISPDTYANYKDVWPKSLDISKNHTIYVCTYDKYDGYKTANYNDIVATKNYFESLGLYVFIQPTLISYEQYISLYSNIYDVSDSSEKFISWNMKFVDNYIDFLEKYKFELNKCPINWQCNNFNRDIEKIIKEKNILTKLKNNDSKNLEAYFNEGIIKYCILLFALKMPFNEDYIRKRMFAKNGYLCISNSYTFLNLLYRPNIILSHIMAYMVIGNDIFTEDDLIERCKYVWQTIVNNGGYNTERFF